MPSLFSILCSLMQADIYRNYEGGEVLRAGCCYRRGYGKIFYFQPGHETFPTYHNPQIIHMNAIHWAKNDYRKEIDCPNIKKIEE